MRISKVKIFLALVVLVGLLALADRYWLGHSGAGRKIASVTGEKGSDLDIKRSMLQKTSVEVIGDDVHIHVGAFANACENYSHLGVLLVAEGVAVNGEPVSIRVRRNCMHVSASETLAPVIVPMARIVALEPDDQKFVDEFYQEFEIKNAAGFWPKEWSVREIKMSDVTTGRAFDADGFEILHVLGNPLVVRAKF